MSRRVGYGTIEQRSTGEEELRARERERVVGLARQGVQPLTRHTEENLRWAFKDREAELVELDELAARTRNEQRERQRRAEQGRELQRMTARVLQEWDDQSPSRGRAGGTAAARSPRGLMTYLRDIRPDIRSGAVPRVDPTSRSGPATRTGDEVDQLARDAAATWREVMGDRRSLEHESEEIDVPLVPGLEQRRGFLFHRCPCQLEAALDAARTAAPGGAVHSLKGTRARAVWLAPRPQNL